MADYTTLGIVISAGLVSILAGLKCIKSIRFGNCCVLDTREVQGNEIHPIGGLNPPEPSPARPAKPKAFFSISSRREPPPAGNSDLSQ